MIKTLIGIRLRAMLGAMAGKGRDGKAKTASRAKLILFAFLYLYIAAAFIFMFGAVAYGMSLSMLPGAEEMYFGMFSLIAFSFIFLFSIFETKSELFDCKDNEILLAMPIPAGSIVISRILTVLIYNYVESALVLLPTIVVFLISGGSPLYAFVGGGLALLGIPLIATSLASGVGYIVAVVSRRMKNKTLVTTLISVVFLLAYFVAYFSFLGNDVPESDAIVIPENPIITAIGSFCCLEPLAVVTFILVTVLTSVLAYKMITRNYLAIITDSRGAKKNVYHREALASRSALSAVTRKELRRFFTSSAYIINSGMGIIMSILFTVMIAVVGPDLVNELVAAEPTIVAFVPVIAYGVIAFGLSMNMISTPSISLEDKHLWIVQSLPVNPADALLAKVMTHIVICTPGSVICSVILGIALKLSILNTVMLILSTVAIVVFTAYFGMLLGLHFPKFDWQNENIAVKQGFAVFGSMFGGMIWAVINAVIVFLLSVFSFTLGALASVIINGVICFIIHRHLTHGGVKKFMTLKQ
jgi:ABC-2 type transport system permease protein